MILLKITKWNASFYELDVNSASMIKKKNEINVIKTMCNKVTSQFYVCPVRSMIGSLSINQPQFLYQSFLQSMNR